MHISFMVLGKYFLYFPNTTAKSPKKLSRSDFLEIKTVLTKAYLWCLGFGYPALCAGPSRCLILSYPLDRILRFKIIGTISQNIKPESTIKAKLMIKSTISLF